MTGDGENIYPLVAGINKLLPATVGSSNTFLFFIYPLLFRLPFLLSSLDDPPPLDHILCYSLGHHHGMKLPQSPSRT